jgi:exoribonuclease-2
LAAPVSDGKITIEFEDEQTLRVREKDIEVLHPGPVNGFAALAEPEDGDVRGAWELLRGGAPVPLEELAELAFGAFTPRNAWAAWRVLHEGLYFTGTVTAVVPRSGEELAAAEEKRENREREGREREAFLERLRRGKPDLPADIRFLQDVEALAFGSSEKSRTMKELGRNETPEEAHRLLLDSGVWSVWINPHPRRCGVSLQKSPSFPIPPPEAGGRKDLTYLPAFAVDSPWSADPDDAVSIETTESGRFLYVHVADPACSVLPGSAPDIEARNRGATAYLPELCCRMLPDETLPLFALGLGELSPALTFRLALDGGAPRAEIFPSMVRVTRLCYGEADLLADGESETGKLLRELFRAAGENFERRLAAGAVNIELPEIHLAVECRGAEGDERPPGLLRAEASTYPFVSIERIKPYRSAEMVRECMLLAGEGAALWAAERRLAFPCAAQETGDLPSRPLPGLAGSWQLRRCMRPRTISARPARHSGLGLDAYSQVTSPLRRYADLLAHQQIRSFVEETKPLEVDELLLRLAAGDAAAQAVTRAERASNAHWLSVFLADKKGSVWDGVVLEKRGNGLYVLIPDLALETQIPAKKGLEPNDSVKLELVRSSVPRAEAVFSA